MQEARPVLSPKRESPHFHQVAGVILRKGWVLMAKRPVKGLLGGMWEFPNARVSGEPSKDFKGVMRRDLGLNVSRKKALLTCQHAYTHFKVTVHAFHCELLSIPSPDYKWIRLSRLSDFPMGKVDRTIAQALKHV